MTTTGSEIRARQEAFERSHSLFLKNHKKCFAQYLLNHLTNYQPTEMTKAMATIKEEKNSTDILNELLKLCEPPSLDSFLKGITNSIRASTLVALVTGEVKTITITPDFSKEEGIMKGFVGELDAEKEILAISAMPLEEVYAKLIPQLSENMRNAALPLNVGGVFARMMESEDEETEDAPSEDKPSEQSAA